MSAGYAELNNTHRLHNKYETVILDCPVQGLPQPNNKTWYHNFTQINAHEYHVDNQTGALKINDLDENLTGMYVCKSSNEFGATSFAQFIEIAEEPSFAKNWISQVLVSRGERVVLKCEFSNGKPKPIVSWMFNGILINANAQNESVEIKEARKADSGVYTCILSNGYHSQKTSNLTLKVLGEYLYTYF